MPSAEDNGGTAARSDIASALGKSRRADAEAQRLAETIRSAREEWQAWLAQCLEHQPYTTMAAAVGVGYVVGGGLSPRAIRALTGGGSRLALALLLQRLLAPAAPDPSKQASTRAETE